MHNVARRRCLMTGLLFFIFAFIFGFLPVFSYARRWPTFVTFGLSLPITATLFVCTYVASTRSGTDLMTGFVVLLIFVTLGGAVGLLTGRPKTWYL
jgi:hypothetical protein